MKANNQQGSEHSGAVAGSSTDVSGSRRCVYTIGRPRSPSPAMGARDSRTHRDGSPPSLPSASSSVLGVGVYGSVFGGVRAAMYSRPQSASYSRATPTNTAYPNPMGTVESGLTQNTNTNNTNTTLQHSYPRSGSSCTSPPRPQSSILPGRAPKLPQPPTMVGTSAVVRPSSARLISASSTFSLNQNQFNFSTNATSGHGGAAAVLIPTPPRPISRAAANNNELLANTTDDSIPCHSSDDQKEIRHNRMYPQDEELGIIDGDSRCTSPFSESSEILPAVHCHGPDSHGKGSTSKASANGVDKSEVHDLSISPTTTTNTLLQEAADGTNHNIKLPKQRPSVVLQGPPNPTSPLPPDEIPRPITPTPPTPIPTPTPTPASFLVATPLTEPKTATTCVDSSRPGAVENTDENGEKPSKDVIVAEIDRVAENKGDEETCAVVGIEALAKNSDGFNSATNSGASHFSTNSSAPNEPKSWAALKALRDAGTAALAITRIQKVMPWATLDTLKERGVNVNNLDKILDKFIRFTYVARGKLLKDALRKNRPALNPAVEWEQFIRGSDSVISTCVLTEHPLLGQQEERGEGMRKVEFTSSHMRFVGWGRDVTAERRLPYREISSIDYSQSLKGAIVVNFKLWSESPVRVRFGASDSHSLVALLVQRMSHNYFRGTNIVGGLMKKTVRIIHFNDVYHLEPFKNPQTKGLVGGAARFLTKVREIQKFHNPMILFSGDFMSPSLMSVLMKGKHMIDAFNLIGVHYGTFGNHEFDYGMTALTDAIHGSSRGNFVFAGSNTRWIMTNMTDQNGTPLGGAIQQEIVVWNGVRVGILGLSENWLPQCGQLKKEDWIYHDSIEVGERIAADMKANAGVEVVVALCHNRLSKDYELAEGCKSIDLILGGHDHFYKNAPRYRTIKSGEEFEFLTEIEVIIDPTCREGRRVKYRSTAHPITTDIEPHPSMETIIDRYEKRLEARMGKVIGTTSVPLDLTEACCRFKEGLAPGFIVDVMADRAKADFAVLGGAAIAGKCIKPPGDITVGDIFSWFPNDTRIMTVRIKGSTVKKMLDVMVREVPLEAPSFPHPSRALSFTINTMRSPTTVQDVCVNGRPIEMDKPYVVAVEDFVGLGKAKYKFIPIEGEMLCDDEAAEQITYWIIDYFEKELERSVAKTDKQLKLFTNIAMRDKLFGISNVKNKMLTAASAVSVPLVDSAEETGRGGPLFGSTSGSLNEVTSTAATRLGDGAAASILAEASRLATYQKAKIETVYFELEIALKRLVPCDQARIFHVIPNTNRAWFRTNNANARRVTISLRGTAVEHLITEKRYTGFIGQSDTNNNNNNNDLPFSPEHEGLGSITATATNSSTTTFLCVPLMFDKQPLCVAVLANRRSTAAKPSSPTQGRTTAVTVREAESPLAFSEVDLDMAGLLLAHAQPVVAFAVSAAEREEEEERRRNLVMIATDLVQSTDTTIVNDKIVAVGKHCRELFRVEKATFYVFDRVKEELWTVRRSVNSQKQIEDVIVRRPLETSGVLANALRLRTIARYHELTSSSSSLSASPPRDRHSVSSSSSAVPAEVGENGGNTTANLLTSSTVTMGKSTAGRPLQDRFYRRNALVVPVESQKEKGEICGVLLLSDKTTEEGSFTLSDERLVNTLVPFIAVAIDTSTEMEVLRTGLDRSKLKAFPVHELTRIRFKRGWGSVRSRLGYIASAHFKEKHLHGGGSEGAGTGHYDGSSSLRVDGTIASWTPLTSE